MNHFRPHRNVQFEGYYSKFDLAGGGHVALIVCSVPKAEKRPHMVSFTYVPADTGEYFQRELWVDKIDMKWSAERVGFELRIPDVGEMIVRDDMLTSYDIRHEDFSFSAETTKHTSWSSQTLTPEALLVHLPLPLHWHVNSLCDPCNYELTIPSFKQLNKQDQNGPGKVHQEKNWASSFPSAHIWIQASKGSPQSALSDKPYHNICLAGGKILGLQAYLLGYRSSTYPVSSSTTRSPSKSILELDMRPPIALNLFSLSPCLSVKPDFERRTFTLSTRDWWKRIDIHAHAPADTFFPLSSPFPEGHRSNFLAESFQATIKVTVYEWTWGYQWWNPVQWTRWMLSLNTADFGHWSVKEEVVFENGSLEFAGGYYGFAGSKTRLGR